MVKSLGKHLSRLLLLELAGWCRIVLVSGSYRSLAKAEFAHDLGRRGDRALLHLDLNLARTYHIVLIVVILLSHLLVYWHP